MRLLQGLRILTPKTDLETPFAALTSALAGRACRTLLIAFAFLSAAVEASRARSCACCRCAWMCGRLAVGLWAVVIHDVIEWESMRVVRGRFRCVSQFVRNSRRSKGKKLYGEMGSGGEDGERIERMGPSNAA